MWEIICTYKIWNKGKMLPYDRWKFYEEELYFNSISWLPSRYASIVNLILINNKWELLLQKRSKKSKQNPWLLSKSVWGHIEFWYNEDETISKESIQEIWVSTHISWVSHFEKDLEDLKLYSYTVAVIKKVKTQFMIIEKMINGVEYKLWVKEYSYIWLYNWETVFNDWEVEWLEKRTIEYILKDIDINPNIYTQSFIRYIKSNRDYLLEFTNSIKL